MIKCNVKTCQYNDHSGNNSPVCSLKEILVGNTLSEAHNKHDTECVSFESK